jgi:hypothetical protein
MDEPALKAAITNLSIPEEPVALCSISLAAHQSLVGFSQLYWHLRVCSGCKSASRDFAFPAAILYLAIPFPFLVHEL